MIIKGRGFYYYKDIIFGVIFLGFLIGGISFLIIRSFKSSPPFPQKGLLAYWSFDEEGEFVKDFKGKRPGQLGSRPTKDPHDPQWFKKGVLGKALKFDGDDFLVILDSTRLSPLQAISLEGWIKKTAKEKVSLSQPIWLNDFRYRRKLKIKRIKKITKSKIKDIQIPLFLDTATLIQRGKLNPDCSDLRITAGDGTTPLSYWIKKGCNQSKTEIWIKAPFLPLVRGRKLYLYYGNPATSSESSFQQTMKIPPIFWWAYPGLRTKEEAKERRSNPKKILISAKDRVILGGSEKKGSFYEWWLEKFTPRKGIKARETRVYRSSQMNFLVDFQFDKKGGSVWAGYTFGDSFEDTLWKIVIFRESFWRKKIKKFNFSSKDDRIKVVRIDSENNIILGGHDSLPGNAQWRVMKLNQRGRVIWQYFINPSPEADYITDLELDSHDNIIVGGVDKSLGDDQWRIEKFSPNGSLIFRYLFNPSEDIDMINDLAIDSQDNIIAVGFDLSQGDGKWRIVKLDPKGNRLWSWVHNPTPQFEELSKVGVDSLDNIIVAGYTYQEGRIVWHLLKFTPQGEKIWEWKLEKKKKLGEIFDMKIDSQDNILILGEDRLRRKGWVLYKISEKKLVFLKGEALPEEERSFFKSKKGVIVRKKGSYELFTREENLFFSLGEVTLSVPLPFNQWNHFAITYNGKAISFYLNGKRLITKAYEGIIPRSDENVIVGYSFIGFIDELKIYRRALSSKEIKNLYKRGK